MRKKVWLLLALIGLIALLSGCMEIDEPINSESEGIWNSFFVYPLSLVIVYIAELFSGSFGLSIIVVTIFLRLILLPLNVKQLKSSQAMQDIQPELKKLQEKYASKDANTQQKLQQETMNLFQKHGVNPLAGCLPIFVQMPILIAMYHAIMRTPEIQTHTFLWFELGSPDYILPLIAAGATFLQQKLMMAGSAAAQNPQMMVMLYVMPIMIGVMGFILPAALALYWVVGNVFMIAQTVFIRKPMMNNQNNGGDKK
ncbi:YidC family membrane integrase SpoIIIJ [Lentibacillus sp. CBA3610]|uniref:YidC family membrane integrase SpoIIIJ n=1 Tax=Lentibacillus sp. CBA3610 TaxID=2518176 RepID=UPI0015960758|nr:YidC family membrane integrase SpoIIIJ [Lentibacillus sp. CBA3610]QKY70835.1 YidC family membrane integrase SpoIIIJ [Lentibacillus sp. CBA3610]